MYRVIFRQVICRMSPEFAHHVGVWGFRYFGWAARLLRGTPFFPRPHPGAAIEALGRVFPAPVGLAAGMDKDARAVRGLVAAGFAFVEVGTVTAQGQPGNEKPRSWRELDVRGLRNRMGFNNAGADAVAARLRRLRRSASGRRALVGVNIGKTKTTPPERAAEDYAYSARLLAPYADFLVVNVSSPNTPGLRDLQAVDSLRPILVAVQREAGLDDGGRRVPVLVKIAPDLDDADVDAVAALARELSLDGVVAVNTTIAHDRGPGGLSGPPLRARALEVVARLRRGLGPEPVIIGMGGIETAEHARVLLDAGATLVEAYTALVYEGPAWPARINAELTRPS